MQLSIPEEIQPETPTPTATPEDTATPTLEPTVEPTVEPTFTPTPEETLTTTPEPTLTPTETAAPTPNAFLPDFLQVAYHPPQALRFQSDFIPARLQQTLDQVIDYDYDPLYRLTDADYSTGDYFHYTYTSNKLSSISGENLNVAFQYNGLGDRLSQTVNGVTTYYALDQAAPLTQVLSDGTNDYIYGLDRIAQVNGSATEYFLTDALGSVRQLVDSTGAVTLAKSYQPYGEALSSAGSGASAFAFTGEQQDTYIKLIFLRSRFYSPLTGTFISRDSWQGDYNRPLSLNRWNYTEGNPVNLTDPTGHQTICSGPECVDTVQNYNLTGWLIRTLNANASSVEVKHIHDLLNLAGPVIPDALRAVMETAIEKHDIDLHCIYTKLRENTYREQAYAAWEALVRSQAQWDFKWQIRNRLAKDGVMLCSSPSECHWYAIDVPGNIHFGYVGMAAGFLPLELYIGAGKAQMEGTDPGSGRIWAFYDDPLDLNAIQFGVDLYRMAKPLNVKSFQSALPAYQSILRPGKEPLFIEDQPYPIESGLGPKFPVNYFDGG